MLLVDSSVWIDYFNGEISPETDYLYSILTQQPILVGDLIMAKVLQGFRHDEDFEAARQAFSYFIGVEMLSPRRAVLSAQNYRSLRKQGVTVRKTIDCLIATFCIDTGNELLHADRDFDPLETHLGLKVVHPERL